MAGAHAALAIVSALHRRERTGEGAYLDVSMLDSAVFWLAYYPHHWWHAHTEPPRSGMRHQYLCPYGPFMAADGQYVNVVVASDTDWRRFCDAVQRPEWIDDPRFATLAARRERRRELDQLVETTIGGRPAGDWATRLDAAGLPHGRVRTLPDVLTHPQLEHRGLFVEAESPVGQVRLVRFPLAGPKSPRVPALGEHTDEVLAELGYRAEEIARLRAERTV